MEKRLKGVENEFLKDALQMVVDGYSRDEIREILDTSIQQTYDQEMSLAGIYRTMARLSPGLRHHRHPHRAHRHDAGHGRRHGPAGSGHGHGP